MLQNDINLKHLNLDTEIVASAQTNVTCLKDYSNIIKFYNYLRCHGSDNTGFPFLKSYKTVLYSMKWENHFIGEE
jgi:hypothetical protein